MTLGFHCIARFTALGSALSTTGGMNLRHAKLELEIQEL
jgi:hypothetical protein